MGIDANQLRTLVIRPAISAIGLWSEDAEELLMLTAATESHLGQYIRQVGMNGSSGAFGIFQMEKATYDLLWKNMILPNTSLKAKIRLFTGYEGKPVVERLITDLSLAAIMTRLFYFDIKSPLPPGNDSYEMAAYWKRWYNTEMGKGSMNKAMEDYKKYCA
jgi:hypothetical protein